MKNRKFIYLLLAVVLFLWSFIGYRIYNGIFSIENNITSNILKTNLNINSTNDSFRLNLNYRDPFLVEFINNTPKAVSVKKENILKTPKPLVVENKPVLFWPTVKYIGLISKQNYTVKLAILSIKGKGYVLNEGESVENLRLLKATKDSVVILFGNEKRSFNK